jgi:RNA polymerase sigma factor (sigma-70 family)
MASTGTMLGSAGERDSLVEEATLARQAAAGDGTAFATLYDRYESRIYNFCHRLLGSPDDAADATQDAFLKVLQRLPKLEGRELNFSAYLFTAARNASYDMIGKRKKAQPMEELPEHGGGEGARDPGDLDLDPERTAMTATLQEEVREANGRLPERQREVLALRELEDRSYDEIAEIMGMNRNSVAQLISRARIKLRDELRGTALAGVAVSSPECERALPLIASRADGQLKDGEDKTWLESHLGTCETCKVSEQAMEEAGRSYRGWLPLVPLLWLRRETIAKAGELVGSDWSAIADQQPAGQDAATQEMSGDGGAGPGGAGGGGGGAAATAGAAASGNGAAAGEPDAGRLRRTLRSRRRGLFALLGALALLLGIFVAVVVGDDGPPAEPTKSSAPPAQQAGAPLAAPTGEDKPKKAKDDDKPKTEAGAITTTTTTPTGVVITTLPAGTPTTGGEPRRTTTRRRRRGGSRQGGGGGPINIPATPDPTTPDPPPQTTTSEPPPTTTSTPTSSTPSNPPCRPGIAGCPRVPRSAGGSSLPPR